MCSTSLLVCHVDRGTIEDTELIDGVLLDHRASHVPGGVDRVEKAKIGLIQFCLSAPKTDVCLCQCNRAHNADGQHSDCVGLLSDGPCSA